MDKSKEEKNPSKNPKDSEQSPVEPTTSADVKGGAASSSAELSGKANPQGSSTHPGQQTLGQGKSEMRCIGILPSMPMMKNKPFLCDSDDTDSSDEDFLKVLPSVPRCKNREGPRDDIT